jgi:SAM-dependent methyltransferase
MADCLIDYDHSANRHTLEGAEAAFASIAWESTPTSILDIGCGEGTWLRAALRAGVRNVVGVDGVKIPPERLLFPASSFIVSDLTQPLDLGRRFDAVLCLEVAEHLPESMAAILISSLTRHSDRIVFSAAAPGQPGQHHINCRWPEYWQGLFNTRGYACDDAIRWCIWNDARIEPWYRQNMFVALRSKSAGQEPRMPAVVHPAILPLIGACQRGDAFDQDVLQIERGRLPLTWYGKVPFRAIWAKVIRRVNGAQTSNGRHV